MFVRKQNPKKISNAFIFSIFFLLVVMQQACKKTDNFINTPAHDIDFVKQFFETKTTPNAAIAAVIEKLKQENERTGFVNKLPANCGLPVWEKILFQKDKTASNANSTTAPGPSANVDENGEEENSKIIIPLTLTNSNLSAVIFAEDLGGNYNINCYTTNGYLYDATHGANVNTLKAMNNLNLFFYLENYTFETTTFYHIPARLFPWSADIDSAGDKTIVIEDVSATTGNNIISCVCVTYTCPSLAGPPPCTPHTECTCTGGDGGDCSWCMPPPGGGGGGGGGTGGGPCDPLKGDNSWYSSYVNPNPCNTPKPPNTDSIVKALLKKDNVDLKRFRDSIWGAAYGHNWEYSFFIKNIGGVVQPLGTKTDSLENQVDFDGNVRRNGNPDGDYHTHQDRPDGANRHPHDPQDVCESNGWFRKLYYRSYVDCGDTLYAIVTENLTLVKHLFQTQNIKGRMEQLPWSQLGYQGSKRRTIGLQALKDLLGSSSTNGLGLYKSVNADKTEFVKLN